MIDSPSDSSTGKHSSARETRRMIRFRPNDSLGDRLPAMHLVRSSWLARALGRATFWFLVLFAISCIFLPWQQSSRCEGIVTARNPNERRQAFLSPSTGIIKWQLEGLQEGSEVKKGDIIMKLETLALGEVELVQQQIAQLALKKGFTETQLSQMRERVDQVTRYGASQVEAYRAKIKSASAKWEQAKNQIDEQRANLRAADFDVQSMEPLRSKTVSEVDYQTAFYKREAEAQKLLKLEQAAEEAYQDLASAENLLESKIQEVQSDINKAEQERSKTQGEIAEIEKEIKKLDVTSQELLRNEIPSPNNGIIQSIVGQVGRTVTKYEELFEIIPDTDDLWVELRVPGMDQNLIKLGDKVRLQFEGWPAIQFVGWPSVAKGTFGGVVVAINPADDGTGKFKIFVGPDPNDVSKEDWPNKKFLKQGVRANAWVLLDQVPLGFEIWRQVNGFPPTRDIGEKAKEEEKSEKPKAPKIK